MEGGRRKVLYGADRATIDVLDESFLSGLVVNKKDRVPDLGIFYLMELSLLPLQAISNVLLFLTIFHHLSSTPSSLVDVVVVVAVSTVALIAAAMLRAREHGWNTFLTWTRERLRQGAVLYIATAIVIPAFRTLTLSISWDTLSVSCGCMLVLHLITYDCSYIAAMQKHRRGVFSLSLGVFTAALLASRLQSDISAIGLCSAASLLFYVVPALLHRVSRASRVASRLSSIASYTLAVLLPHWLNLDTPYLGLSYPSNLYFFAGVPVTICVVGPILFFLSRSFKRVINGPWDEVKPEFAYGRQ